MQLLAAKFNEIALEIDSTNAQIAALQAKLSELQEHQQQLQSVEQAMQSALAQTDTALMMANHVDPSQVEIFRDALAAKFNNSAVALIESADNSERAQEPDPDSPAPETATATEPAPEPVIDVHVITSEPTAPASATTTQPAPESIPVPVPDIEQQLTKLSLVSLRMLAKSKSVDARGTKANITARLQKLVTNDDLRAVS